MKVMFCESMKLINAQDGKNSEESSRVSKRVEKQSPENGLVGLSCGHFLEDSKDNRI